MSFRACREISHTSPPTSTWAFVSFLRSIPAAETEALYLLGDIWDFWYEYRDVVPKGYVRVFGALADLMDAGVKVYFFSGNHDIWTYHYFEEQGMKRLEQPFVKEIGSTNTIPGVKNETMGLRPKDRDEQVMCNVLFCDSVAFRLFGIELLEKFKEPQSNSFYMTETTFAAMTGQPYGNHSFEAVQASHVRVIITSNTAAPAHAKGAQVAEICIYGE